LCVLPLYNVWCHPSRRKFLMPWFGVGMRPPTRSTPFPTRRSSDLRLELLVDGEVRLRAVASDEEGWKTFEVPVTAGEHDVEVRRSEEHTSELQSRENLVCRLLLEKKNEVARRRLQ